MKPFDLQAALAGAPVVTRAGLPVADIHHFPSASDERVVGVLGGLLMCWYEDGRYVESGESIRDLMMADEEST